TRPFHSSGPESIRSEDRGGGAERPRGHPLTAPGLSPRDGATPPPESQSLALSFLFQRRNPGERQPSHRGRHGDQAPPLLSGLLWALHHFRARAAQGVNGGQEVGP